VLTQPPDRVSYRQLTPTDEDLQSIMRHARRAGILDRDIALGDLVDRRFIPEYIRPVELVVRRPEDGGPP